MTKLLLAHIHAETEKGNKRFFVSGFPRCEDNTKTWKELAADKCKVVALLYLSYTRKEYHIELDEEETVSGEKFDRNIMNERYNYFLTNTRYVFDDFGKRKLIKLTAKLPDETICSKVMKSGKFKKLGVE